jgi:putative SbcD/Mre11-related phosphoesterase
MAVEPVPNSPAGVVEANGERLLVVADFHAGIEAVLRTEGVELDSRADQRRSRLVGLLAETDPDRLVVLGDLVHAIGDPWEAERSELEELFGSLAVPVTVVKGNHDGGVEGFLKRVDHDVSVTPTDGIRFGSVGFAHGHTWPGRDVLESDVICVGHEHPLVRLEDEVGGSQVERVWLRGQLDSAVFEEYYDDEIGVDGKLVVFPAFNDLSGGTQVNVKGQRFLSPFLPEGLVGGEAYLLDGTRLGVYRRV